MLDPPLKRTQTVALLTLNLVILLSHVSGAKVRPRGSGFEFAADYDAVVGVITHENFSCEGRPYGYYADQTLDCKVFHICSPIDSNSGRIVKTLMYSFFCPEKTIFSQDSKTCISVEFALPCQRAHTLYAQNKAFGQPFKGTRKQLPSISSPPSLHVNHVTSGVSGAANESRGHSSGTHRFSSGLSAGNQKTPQSISQSFTGGRDESTKKSFKAGGFENKNATAIDNSGKGEDLISNIERVLLEATEEGKVNNKLKFSEHDKNKSSRDRSRQHQNTISNRERNPDVIDEKTNDQQPTVQIHQPVVSPENQHVSSLEHQQHQPISSPVHRTSSSPEHQPTSSPRHQQHQPISSPVHRTASSPGHQPISSTGHQQHQPISSPDHRTTQSSGNQPISSPGHQQHQPIASPGHRTTSSPGHQPISSPRRQPISLPAQQPNANNASPIKLQTVPQFASGKPQSSFVIRTSVGGTGNQRTESVGNNKPATIGSSPTHSSNSLPARQHNIIQENHTRNIAIPKHSFQPSEGLDVQDVSFALGKPVVQPNEQSFNNNKSTGKRITVSSDKDDSSRHEHSHSEADDLVQNLTDDEVETLYTEINRFLPNSGEFNSGSLAKDKRTQGPITSDSPQSQKHQLSIEHKLEFHEEEVKLQNRDGSISKVTPSIVTDALAEILQPPPLRSIEPQTNLKPIRISEQDANSFSDDVSPKRESFNISTSFQNKRTQPVSFQSDRSIHNSNIQISNSTLRSTKSHLRTSSIAKAETTTQVSIPETLNNKIEENQAGRQKDSIESSQQKSSNILTQRGRLSNRSQSPHSTSVSSKTKQQVHNNIKNVSQIRRTSISSTTPLPLTSPTHITRYPTTTTTRSIMRNRGSRKFQPSNILIQNSVTHRTNFRNQDTSHNQVSQVSHLNKESPVQKGHTSVPVQHQQIHGINNAPLTPRTPLVVLKPKVSKILETQTTDQISLTDTTHQTSNHGNITGKAIHKETKQDSEPLELEKKSIVKELDHDNEQSFPKTGTALTGVKQEVKTYLPVQNDFSKTIHSPQRPHTSTLGITPEAASSAHRKENSNIEGAETDAVEKQPHIIINVPRLNEEKPSAQTNLLSTKSKNKVYQDRILEEGPETPDTRKKTSSNSRGRGRGQSEQVRKVTRTRISSTVDEKTEEVPQIEKQQQNVQRRKLSVKSIDSDTFRQAGIPEINITIPYAGNNGSLLKVGNITQQKRISTHVSVDSSSFRKPTNIFRETVTKSHSTGTGQLPVEKEDIGTIPNDDNSFLTSGHSAQLNKTEKTPKVVTTRIQTQNKNTVSRQTSRRRNQNDSRGSATFQHSSNEDTELNKDKISSNGRVRKVVRVNGNQRAQPQNSTVRQSNTVSHVQGGAFTTDLPQHYSISEDANSNVGQKGRQTTTRKRIVVTNGNRNSSNNISDTEQTKVNATSTLVRTKKVLKTVVQPVTSHQGTERKTNKTISVNSQLQTKPDADSSKFVDGVKEIIDNKKRLQTNSSSKARGPSTGPAKKKIFTKSEFDEIEKQILKFAAANGAHLIRSIVIKNNQTIKGDKTVSSSSLPQQISGTRKSEKIEKKDEISVGDISGNENSSSTSRGNRRFSGRSRQQGRNTVTPKEKAVTGESTNKEKENKITERISPVKSEAENNGSVSQNARGRTVINETKGDFRNNQIIQNTSSGKQSGPIASILNSDIPKVSRGESRNLQNPRIQSIQTTLSRRRTSNTVSPRQNIKVEEDEVPETVTQSQTEARLSKNVTESNTEAQLPSLTNPLLIARQNARGRVKLARGKAVTDQLPVDLTNQGKNESAKNSSENDENNKHETKQLENFVNDKSVLETKENGSLKSIRMASLQRFRARVSTTDQKESIDTVVNTTSTNDAIGSRSPVNLLSSIRNISVKRQRVIGSPASQAQNLTNDIITEDIKKENQEPTESRGADKLDSFSAAGHDTGNQNAGKTSPQLQPRQRGRSRGATVSTEETTFKPTKTGEENVIPSVGKISNIKNSVEVTTSTAQVLGNPRQRSRRVINRASVNGQSNSSLADANELQGTAEAADKRQNIQRISKKTLVSETQSNTIRPKISDNKTTSTVQEKNSAATKAGEISNEQVPKTVAGRVSKKRVVVRPQAYLPETETFNKTTKNSIATQDFNSFFSGFSAGPNNHQPADAQKENSIQKNEIFRKVTSTDDRISSVFDFFTTTTERSILSEAKRVTTERSRSKSRQPSRNQPTIDGGQVTIKESNNNLQLDSTSVPSSLYTSDSHDANQVPTARKVSDNKRRVLKQVIPAREFKKISDGDDGPAVVVPGLKLRVVGTSVESSVSATQADEREQDLAKKVKNTDGDDSAAPLQKSLTDLELDALKTLTYANSPIRSQVASYLPRNGRQVDGRKVITKRRKL